MDLLRHCAYVLAVVDEGSFTDAAIELGITQPPLSQGVRRLEERWGVRLLDRSAKGVTLTPAGRRLVPVMRSLVSEAKVLDQRALLLGQEADDLGYGVDLAVGDFAQVVLARWSAGLEQAVRPRIGAPDQLVDAVRADELDVAVVQHPCDVDGVLSGPSLVLDTLLLLPRGAASAVGARAPRLSTHGIPVDLPLALRPRAGAPAAHDLLVHEARRAGHNGEVLEVGDGTGSVWVSGGAAWTIVPAQAARALPDGSADVIPAPARLRLRAVVVGRSQELVQQVQEHAGSVLRTGFTTEEPTTGG